MGHCVLIWNVIHFFEWKCRSSSYNRYFAFYGSIFGSAEENLQFALSYLCVVSPWMFQLLKGDRSMSGLQIKQTRAPIILDLEGGRGGHKLPFNQREAKTYKSQISLQYWQIWRIGLYWELQKLEKNQLSRMRNKGRNRKGSDVDGFILWLTLNRKTIRFYLILIVSIDLNQMHNHGKKSQRNWYIVPMPPCIIVMTETRMDIYPEHNCIEWTWWKDDDVY